MLKLKLFLLKWKLARLTKDGGALNDGKILAVSQQLDEMINAYYKQNPVLRLHRPVWWKQEVHK